MGVCAAHWPTDTPTVVVQGGSRVPIGLPTVFDCVPPQVLQKYTGRPAKRALEQLVLDEMAAFDEKDMIKFDHSFADQCHKNLNVDCAIVSLTAFWVIQNLVYEGATPTRSIHFSKTKCRFYAGFAAVVPPFLPKRENVTRWSQLSECTNYISSG